MPTDRQPARLDRIDEQILAELRADARLPIKLIADRVGIAPSTAHARLHRLLETGVITGFRTEINQTAAGRGLQAMISIRLKANARGDLTTFGRYLVSLPEVERVYFVTGDQDFLAHVAVSDSEQLRTLVASTLSTRPEIASTNTSVIFDSLDPYH